MIRLLLLITTCSLLAACSGKQVYLASSEAQYCYTDEKIQIDNGQTVNSKTTVQCSDKPRIEHVVKDSGVASDCRISRPINSNRNNPKAGETLLCKFTDHVGNVTWRPVNEAFAYPTFN
ncbi:hypothetical protein N9I97_01145 [bacterium]|nr:hypothetical protein [bacterium]